MLLDRMDPVPMQWTYFRRKSFVNILERQLQCSRNSETLRVGIENNNRDILCRIDEFVEVLGIVSNFVHLEKEFEKHS
jgi:hypothetical protein